MSEPVVISLGCRLNGFESEVMRRHAKAAGADNVVIVNTCAVTGEAVRQAAQAIRRARRERPEAMIVVTGCAAQVEPERFGAMAEVDRVIGNDIKMRAETYRRVRDPEAARIQVNDIMGVRAWEPHPIDGFAARARAWVEIQNGCDHRCTFCIIPFGRGPSRSVPGDEVVSQVHRLVEAGYREIVLTGVDITSYGRDLPGATTLGQLVRQVLAHVPALDRLRLSSIDMVEIDGALMDAIAGEPRLMPHLHLSLQAGDDLILKRMKRRHRRADAVRVCSEVRRLRSDIVFGADLITGFPTETEEMFDRTLSLVEECGLTYLHVFPFSPRKGTPAASMPQVAQEAVTERARRLRSAGERHLVSYLDALQGAVVDVLLEGGGSGRTPQFAEVRVSGPGRPGDLLRTRVTGHDGRRLAGEVLA